MAVNKDELLQIFERLPESVQQPTYDYLQYLSLKSNLTD